jgi:hypothetical protein
MGFSLSYIFAERGVVNVQHKYCTSRLWLGALCVKE